MNINQTESIQLNDWTQAIVSLPKQKMFVNLEGSISTNSNQACRELRLEEIIKISYKILKKQPESFKRQDICDNWKQAIYHLHTLQSSSSKNSVMEELLNYTNQLANRREEMVQVLVQSKEAKSLLKQVIGVVGPEDTTKLLPVFEDIKKQAYLIPITAMIKQLKTIQQELKSTIDEKIIKIENDFLDYLPQNSVRLCPVACQNVKHKLTEKKEALLRLKPILLHANKSEIDLFTLVEKKLDQALKQICMLEKLGIGLDILMSTSYAQQEECNNFLLLLEIIFRDYCEYQLFPFLTKDRLECIEQFIERINNIANLITRLEQWIQRLQGTRAQEFEKSLENVLKYQSDLLNQALSKLDSYLIEETTKKLGELVSNIEDNLSRLNQLQLDIKSMRNSSLQDLNVQQRISQAISFLNTRLGQNTLKFKFEQTDKQKQIFDQSLNLLGSLSQKLSDSVKCMSSQFTTIDTASYIEQDAALCKEGFNSIVSLNREWMAQSQGAEYLIEQARQLGQKLLARKEKYDIINEELIKIKAADVALLSKDPSIFNHLCQSFLLNNITEEVFRVQVKSHLQKKSITKIISNYESSIFVPSFLNKFNRDVYALIKDVSNRLPELNNNCTSVDQINKKQLDLNYYINLYARFEKVQEILTQYEHPMPVGGLLEMIIKMYLDEKMDQRAMKLQITDYLKLWINSLPTIEQSEKQKQTFKRSIDFIQTFPDNFDSCIKFLRINFSSIDLSPYTYRDLDFCQQSMLSLESLKTEWKALRKRPEDLIEQAKELGQKLSARKEKYDIVTQQLAKIKGESSSLAGSDPYMLTNLCQSFLAGKLTQENFIFQTDCHYQEKLSSEVLKKYNILFSDLSYKFICDNLMRWKKSLEIISKNYPINEIELNKKQAELDNYLIICDRLEKIKAVLTEYENYLSTPVEKELESQIKDYLEGKIDQTDFKSQFIRILLSQKKLSAGIVSSLKSKRSQLQSLFGVAQVESSFNTLQGQFKKWARHNHPDKSPNPVQATENFKKVNDLLGDIESALGIFKNTALF